MLFPPAMDMTQLSNDGTSEDSELRCDIAEAMYAAASTGARVTANVSYSGVDVDDLWCIAKELSAAGYAVTISTTNLTVRWA